jgi:PmbA protein
VPDSAGDGSDVDLPALAARIVERVRGGEQMEVYVSRSVETDVRAYEGEVESLSSAASAGVGIRVIEAGRQGFAYAGSLDERVIAETLDEARDNVRFATPDPAVVLAEPDGRASVELDVWDESVPAMGVAEKVERTVDLERRVRGADPRIRQVSSADYGDLASEAAIASTTGITAHKRRTLCSMSAAAIAGEGTDSHTGVGFSAVRGPEQLDPDRVVTDAVTRATRLIGATKARSGRTTVVFDPRVTSTLLAMVSSALSGEAVTKGRSLFAGRVGEEIGVPALTIVDDPTDARALGATSHDAEGLPCRRNVLVDSGVLCGFVFDTTAARRAGTSSTASAVRGGYASTPVAGCRAVVLTPGALDAAGIMAEVGEGLYVQSVTGVHSGVNVVSGDFSVGAEGVMIRSGQFAEPVREVTIASTIQRMLLSVTNVGADLEWLPGVAAGQTLSIEGMALSGA